MGLEETLKLSMVMSQCCPNVMTFTFIFYYSWKVVYGKSEQIQLTSSTVKCFAWFQSLVVFYFCLLCLCHMLLPLYYKVFSSSPFENYSSSYFVTTKFCPKVKSIVLSIEVFCWLVRFCSFISWHVSFPNLIPVFCFA